MTAESLTALLKPLMNRQLLMEMAVKARQQAQPDATTACGWFNSRFVIFE